jgi:hypothetical protein
MNLLVNALIEHILLFGLLSIQLKKEVNSK